MNFFYNLSVAKKTATIFGVILVVFVVNQSVVFSVQQISQNTSIDAVNASGRNRTLSQSISAASYQLLTGNKEAYKILENSIYLHDSTIKALKYGGVVPGMSLKGPIMPVRGTSIHELNKVEAIWNEYKKAAFTILNEKELIDAANFISSNYTIILKQNDLLVQALVNDPFLKAKPVETVSAVIDIAGRNRMLSQRIGLLSLEVLQGKDERLPDLLSAINLHDISINLLKDGGFSEEKQMIIPAASENITVEINKAMSIWLEFKKNATIIGNSEEFLKSINIIGERYQELLAQNNELVKAISFEAQKEKNETVFSLTLVLLSMFIIVLVIIIVAYYLLNKIITKPIIDISNNVEILSTGKIPEITKIEQNDEIGSLYGAVLKMIENIKSYSFFSKQIGKGDFNSNFEPASNEDDLGKSLISMRDQLIEVEKQSKIRNWKTEGIAKFADILRLSNTDVKKFYQSIITNLVKYLEANQGALFIVNNQDENNIKIELKATYAYDRVKFINKTVYPGEGLIGQAYLEGEYIYMTDVPDSYAKITSGLGLANPQSFIILPLKVNEEILGIIEIATFVQLKEYQIEFLQTLGESIASSIQSSNITENTKRLLIESKEMEESLKAQEEEIRQTMEEMQSSNESMLEREADLLRQLEELQNKDN